MKTWYVTARWKSPSGREIEAGTYVDAEDLLTAHEAAKKEFDDALIVPFTVVGVQIFDAMIHDDEPNEE